MPAMIAKSPSIILNAINIFSRRSAPICDMDFQNHSKDFYLPNLREHFRFANNLLYISSVLFEIKNNIGIITLNRPDKLNSFNREMALLMQQKLDECRSNAVRCVYITGAGKG